jgi:hypothetical protein
MRKSFEAKNLSKFLVLKKKKNQSSICPVV